MATETRFGADGQAVQPVMVISAFAGTLLALLGLVGIVFGGTGDAVAGVGRTLLLDSAHIAAGVTVVVSAAYDDGALANVAATAVGGLLLAVAVGGLVFPTAVGAVFGVTLLTSVVHVLLGTLVLGVGLMLRQPDV